MDDMQDNQARGMGNVLPEDGRLMRMLAESLEAKHVVELGTANGYSAMWFCLALRATGGKLSTHEIDSERIAMATSGLNEKLSSSSRRVPGAPERSSTPPVSLQASGRTVSRRALPSSPTSRAWARNSSGERVTPASPSSGEVSRNDSAEPRACSSLHLEERLVDTRLGREQLGVRLLPPACHVFEFAHEVYRLPSM